MTRACSVSKLRCWPCAIGWPTRCSTWSPARLSINDRLGGRQVSQVLDRLADSTRAQLRIQHEVRAQQARTVLSARIVAAAPLVALVGLRATNPRYLSIFDSVGRPDGADRLRGKRRAWLRGHAVPDAAAGPATGAGAMTPLALADSVHVPALDARVVVLPLLLGLGLYLVLTTPAVRSSRSPISASGCDLLDVDERIRMAELGRQTAPAACSPRASWKTCCVRSSKTPVGCSARVLVRLGLGGGRELERACASCGRAWRWSQFLGEKVATGVIVAATFPLMNLLHITPFGAWPVWLWLVGFRHRLRLARSGIWSGARSPRAGWCLMELPTILDMLTLATSAGMALEQALEEVARQSEGVVAQRVARGCARAGARVSAAICWMR